MDTLTYQFINFPTEMVENIPYTFQLRVLTGTGRIWITNPSSTLLGIVTTPTGSPISLSTGTVLTYTIMSSKYHSLNTATLRFSFQDDSSLDTPFYIDKTINLSEYNDFHPYRGNIVSWSKNMTQASGYNIYSKNETDSALSLLVSVPHDPYSGDLYQEYIDRDGGLRTKYSVAAIDLEGNEGVRSFPRHAPDIDTPLCLVQGNVTDIGMVPINELSVLYRIKELPAVFGNTITLRGSVLVRTDDRGYFEFTAPQGSVILLTIKEAEFSKSLLIPNSTSADLKELFAMAQNQ